MEYNIYGKTKQNEKEEMRNIKFRVMISDTEDGKVKGHRGAFKAISNALYL